LASNGTSKLNVSSSIMSMRREEKRPGVARRRKVGVKGGCSAAGPLLSIISCPPMARSRGERGDACCRLRTGPFLDGMTMSRERLLVEDAGIER
jgi:hypothetical protein